MSPATEEKTPDMTLVTEKVFCIARADLETAGLLCCGPADLGRLLGWWRGREVENQRERFEKWSLLALDLVRERLG